MSKKYARIDPNTNKCAEFIDFDPTGKFHSDLKFVEVPNRYIHFVDKEYIEKEGEIVPPSSDYIKKQLYGFLANFRYRKEVGGITLDDGSKISTRRQDQAQLSNTVNHLKNSIITKTNWKVNNNEWIEITENEATEILNQLVIHVEKCFNAEKDVKSLIDNIENESELLDFDISTNFNESYNS